ncbi:hypothetical protein JTM58_32610 [Pseudomonas aeruginosa]|nr:hypothetical protein [Pseudomonas aeruginosa]
MACSHFDSSTLDRQAAAEAYFFNRIGLSLTAALFNADGTPLLFSRRGVMPRQE